MDPQTQQITLAEVLALADAQHGVVTRAQLTELGLSAEASSIGCGAGVCTAFGAASTPSGGLSSHDWEH